MSFGNTIITGSVVNMILIISVMTCGVATGLTVAVIAPVMSKLLGIGPLWSLIPVIAVGNAVLILLWHIIGNRKTKNKYIAYVPALIIAAGVKALVLHVGVVRIAIPLFLNLSEQQASVISNMYSLSQFVTALTGGVCAAIILSTLKKAIKRDV